MATEDELPGLTREEMARLVARLNQLARQYPRIVGNLLAHCVPVELDEILAAQRPADEAFVRGLWFDPSGPNLVAGGMVRWDHLLSLCVDDPHDQRFVRRVYTEAGVRLEMPSPK